MEITAIVRGLPALNDATMDDAKHILSENKLRVSVTEQFDDDVVEGVVISQTPDANSQVKEDRTVTIYVSKGATTNIYGGTVTGGGRYEPNADATITAKANNGVCKGQFFL